MSAVEADLQGAPARWLEWTGKVLGLPLASVIVRDDQGLVLVMKTGDQCLVKLSDLTGQAAFRRALIRQAYCPRRVASDVWDMVVDKLLKAVRDARPHGAAAKKKERRCYGALSDAMRAKAGSRARPSSGGQGAQEAARRRFT